MYEHFASPTVSCPFSSCIHIDNKQNEGNFYTLRYVLIFTLYLTCICAISRAINGLQNYLSFDSPNHLDWNFDGYPAIIPHV